MVAVAGIIMLVGARITFQDCDISYMDTNRGILFPSADLWITDPWLKMVCNTGLTILVGLSWMLLIQIFNPFRALTTLQTSFFLIMMTATPDLLDQFYSGTVLVTAIVICLALLWSSFADTGKMRHIFLIFTILSTLSMTQYCFAVYIPVFIIGCIQMKILNIKAVIACLLGLTTPWWIVFGSGIATFDDLHFPEMTSYFATFDVDDTVHIILVTVITSIVFIAGWFSTVMKVLTLNSNLRAFNGSIAIVGLVTVVALMADYTNIEAYLPTLYLATSYQLAHLFGNPQSPRSFIPAISIMTIFLGFYVWRIFL